MHVHQTILYYLEIASLIISGDLSSKILKAKVNAIRNNLVAAEGVLRGIEKAPENLKELLKKLNLGDTEQTLEHLEEQLKI